MNSPRVTLLASQEHQLRDHLDQHPQHHERAAVVLFRRFHYEPSGVTNSDRYVAVEVHPFEDDWITSSSTSHIAFALQPLRELFRKCADEHLVFGFVHNHPTGFADFSDTDEDNERTLVTALRNRNGPGVHLVALLWTTNTWKARVRAADSPDTALPARHVIITSRPLRLFTRAQQGPVDQQTFARQAAAFGQPFQRQLQSLRVAVVGAGGTGSSTATLLARAGVGELILFDADTVDHSNLNRLRGAASNDVGKNKAEVLRDFIKSLAMRTEVAVFATHIDNAPQAVDALSTCDVVFGCTDDQIGREILNTAAYAYALPYIDVGLGGQISEDEDGVPYLRYHHGRISTILPEDGECLFCQGIIQEVAIQHEYALRENPLLSGDEARERYLGGGGEAAPGVGPFTSAVADYGVATLFDLLKGFRKFPAELRWDAFSIDFVRMTLRSGQEKSNLLCPYCKQRQYLLLKEKYRLNRPALGKPNNAV